MALDLTNRNVAHEIAERIRCLIARQDAGDVTAAARRLARPIADVYSPERVLSAGDAPAALEFLVSVVRGYETDACWLITGRSGHGAPSLSADARVTIVELIGELSDRLLDEVRTEHEAARHHV